VSGAPSMCSDRPPVGITPTALGRFSVGLSRQLPRPASSQNAGLNRDFRPWNCVSGPSATPTNLRPIHAGQPPSTTS